MNNTCTLPLTTPTLNSTLPPTAAAASNTTNSYLLDLGNHIKVEVCNYKDDIRVDLRKWTSWDLRRTKCGFFFNEVGWWRFVDQIDFIQGAMDMLRRGGYVNVFHEVAEGIYATLQSPRKVVDLRLFYTTDDGLLKPTSHGVRLTFEQFDLLAKDDGIEPAIQALHAYSSQ